MFLLLGILLSTKIHSQELTLQDSLSKSLNNCAFLFDSISKENKKFKTIIETDSLNIIEHRDFISVLELDNSKLQSQNNSKDSIIIKKDRDIVKIKKQHKSETRQEKIKSGIFIGGTGLIFTGIGYILGRFTK
jgi:hypothetical protein